MNLIVGVVYSFHVWGDVATCLMPVSCRKDRGDMFLQNVSWLQVDYASFWEPNIYYFRCVSICEGWYWLSWEHWYCDSTVAFCESNAKKKLSGELWNIHIKWGSSSWQLAVVLNSLVSSFKDVFIWNLIFWNKIITDSVKVIVFLPKHGYSALI